MLALIQEIFYASEKAWTDREAKPDAVTKKSHPDIAAAARKTRRDFVQGEKLVHSVKSGERPYESLEWWEQHIHQRYQ